MRNDISENLIHFTSGNSDDEAFGNLLSILDEESLIGSNRFIKSGDNCVCFTETPLESVVKGFVNNDGYSRYSPYGVVYPKSRIFESGGRPVIYQPDDEFTLLPGNVAWRHVRYEPNGDPPVDFTWEREWRVQCNSLPLIRGACGVVVPSETRANEILEYYDLEQQHRFEMYSQVFDYDLARQHADQGSFPWQIFVLG